MARLEFIFSMEMKQNLCHAATNDFLSHHIPATVSAAFQFCATLSELLFGSRSESNVAALVARRCGLCTQQWCERFIIFYLS